ncbi:MAG: hypothetical protein ABR588_10735 [Sphingomicrobium sp.]
MQRKTRHRRPARARLGLARGNDIVPIPGTKRQKYLDQNIARRK